MSHPSPLRPALAAHRRLLVPALLVALLAALVPLPVAAAPTAATPTAAAPAATSDRTTGGDAIGPPQGQEWHGDVRAEPHQFRPDGTPPRIDLLASADHGPTTLFVPGATARILDGWELHVVSGPLPLTVVDGARANLTPPPLPVGHYVFEIVSGGSWTRTAFDVLTPRPGHGIWFDHLEDIPAGTTEVSLTATGAFLDASTRVTEVNRFRGGEPVADAASSVRFELVDQARGKLVFSDPLQLDDEVHVSFADDQGFGYGDIHLWVQPPGATLRADQLLLGATRGARLEVEPSGFTFDASASVRLRTFGRVLPAGALGSPTVASDGSLHVPVTAELDLGWYELRVTAGGQRFDLSFRVGPPNVDLWSGEDLVRDVETGTVWFSLVGLGQRWDASTRVSLRRGATVVATTTPSIDTFFDLQYLEGELAIPAGTAGIHTLQVSHAGTHVDLPVRVSGPKLWLDGSVDAGGGTLTVFPDGFWLEGGEQVTVRTDTGRTVANTTVSDAAADDGYLQLPLSGATGVSILTATVTQDGVTYTGRAFNGWFEGGVEGLLAVDPAVSPAGSRPTTLQLAPSPGSFGPSLLSSTLRTDRFGTQPVPAPVPTRVGDRLTRQAYPGGLLDGYHDVMISDGDLAWFGVALVGDGDLRSPNLEVAPYHLPRGVGAGTVVTVRSRSFPFALGTVVTLRDEQHREVAGGIRSVQVGDTTTLRVTLGTTLVNGTYTLEVDVNGGYDHAAFVVGALPDDQYGGPRWASSAKLTAANVTSSSLTLTWPASSSAGPITYTVLRGAAQVAGPISGTSTTVTGLSPDTPYTFTVRARDGQGITSTQALQLTTKTRALTTSSAEPPRCRDAAPANFDDVPLTYTHARAVFCAAGHGLVLGRPGGATFDPGGTLTRGQLASILLRSLEASKVRLTAERGGFTDIVRSPHETAIRKLSAAGVIQGKSDTVFDPQGAVTRGQLMTLLDRASRLMVEAYPAVPGPRFGDTAGSPHASAIDRLNAAGVARGSKDGRSFGPNLPVNRGQAASFVTRWLEDQADRRAG